MTITVKWGKEKYIFELPGPDTPLGVLRDQVADRTGLAPASFKLIHTGAVMKDDTAPVSAYGLRPRSLVALIAPNDPLPLAPRSSEDALLGTIAGELAHVRAALAPAVHAFRAAAAPEPEAHKEHTRLAELLLQALLRLDAIQAPAAWERARAERKDAVREVQALLDMLDGESDANQSLV